MRTTECIAIVNEVADFLRNHSGRPKIIIKLARNLGDTIHMISVFRHYKLKYPNCVIGFITQQMYEGVHYQNRDIDKLGLLPNDLTPQERLALWDPIKNLNGIDLKIIPAIHPFGAVHNSNTWSHEIMTDQVMRNAGIEDGHPLGGRRYIIPISADDKAWALEFFKSRDILPRNCAIFEYNSYSHSVAWSTKEWEQLIKEVRAHGGHMIGLAGQKEGIINGMIDARGTTWARTVALANLVPKMIGVGSGITMLAAGAEHQPLIIELNIPPSVSISVAGYAPSIRVANANVTDITTILNTPNDQLRDRITKI